MKHNWTRPIVKFIEDDIVASGIGGATGPARFFAARGAGLLGDGVNKTFGSGDTRTWSAWDNMFVTTGAQRQKRRRIIRRKFTQVRRKRYGMRTIRRRTYRRKSSWATRVRRAALKSHESKRHQTVVSQETIDDDTLDTTAIARIPDLDQATTQGAASKSTRNGQVVNLTGFSSTVHLRNETTEPMIVKMVWFYKTKNEADIQRIFKNPVTEESVTRAEVSTYWGRMTTSMGNKQTRILKTMTVQLSEKELGTMGTDTKLFKVWIPFKKVQKYENTLEGGISQTLDVHFGIIAFNKEGVPFTTGGGTGISSVLFAQQRHILYYRDP